MNKEIKQILLNQVAMMRCLRGNAMTSEHREILEIHLQKTSNLLNPKEKDPTIREQTDKSMNRVIKAGQDCPRCGVIGVCAERLQYHNSGRCLPRSKFGKREK